MSPLGLLAGNAVCFLTSAAHDTWVIDSGASDHITPHCSLLESAQRISYPCSITMPNGKQATVTHIGSVVIADGIELQQVLCVPNFHFNLLSASKLTKQLSSNVVFTPTTCLIQDNLRQTSMVLGKESSGLYYVLKEPYYESRQPSHGVAAQTQRISPFISNLHLSNIDLGTLGLAICLLMP